MPFLLNEKIRNLTPYDPIQGEYRIRLDANESFLQPDAALQTEIAGIAAGIPLNRYPDPYAQALCNGFAAFYGVDPAHVTAGNGTDELLSLLVQSFLQKGDTLLSFMPDFSMYRFYGALSEVRLLTLEKTAQEQIDADAAIVAAKERQVRMILFSNPCNPTSLLTARETVLRFVRETETLVVADEAYMDFADQSVLDCAAQYDNLIVLRTCSKAIGLAGVRLGFAVANPVLTKALRAAKSPYNVNVLSQAIGAAVFARVDLLRQGIVQIRASRDRLLNGLREMETQFPQYLQIIGGEANFVFCKLHRAQDCFRFLMGKGIIVRCFGEHLRITAGKPEENEEFVQSLREFLNAIVTLETAG